MTSSTDTQDLLKPDIHSSSEEYRQRFSGVAGKWFLHTQDRITKELLESTTTQATVIDFGGGHGQNIEACQELGLKVSILSSDEECNVLLKNELAGQSSDAINTSIEFIIGSLTNSGLAQQSYDTALSYRMIPHLSDWQGHIKELCAISKNTVIVEFPNTKGVNAFSEKLFKLKKSVEGNTRQFSLFSIQQISDEFSKHGFMLKQAKGQYLLPMVLHRALKNETISKMLESVIGVILPRNKMGSPLICKFERTND